MAKNEGERRMLFDIRGRRKNVIRVVYAILALLMGASLFLVIGPVNIGELVGNSTSVSTSKVFDEQIERIEQRLARNPNDAQLLLTLTRAQINAGNSRIEVTSETEVPTVSPEARKEFEAAAETWQRYLKKAGGEPSASVAQLVAGTFFRLAETSTEVEDVEENVALAAEAQRIAAEEQPSVGSLTTLAIYEYFNGNFAAGDKAVSEAEAKASKAQAKTIKTQLAEYRKRAKQYRKSAKEARKARSKAGKEALENPLGGSLGGAGGSLGTP